MAPGLGQRLFGSLLFGLLVAVVLGIAVVLLLGRPPRTFHMAAGAEGGMYQQFAVDLREELATRGFELVVLETAGSIENAELLRDRTAGIAFVQSGTELLTDLEGVELLRDGSIDAAALVVAPNAPIIAELAAIPGPRILPIDRHESIARRLPFVTAVEVPRAILDVALDVPPDAVRALAARATVVGTADLHPDLARLIVAVLPAAIPPAWVGDPHALPGLADTQLPVNEDARQFLDEGPTPLEGSLPFEAASPLSRSTSSSCHPCGGRPASTRRIQARFAPERTEWLGGLNRTFTPQDWMLHPSSSWTDLPHRSALSRPTSHLAAASSASGETTDDSRPYP